MQQHSDVIVRSNMCELIRVDNVLIYHFRQHLSWMNENIGLIKPVKCELFSSDPATFDNP